MAFRAAYEEFREEWDGFSRAEIEEAVSYGNVCSFFGVPTGSEEEEEEEEEQEEEEKGGADRWANSVLESDPTLRERAFRRISGFTRDLLCLDRRGKGRSRATRWSVSCAVKKPRDVRQIPAKASTDSRPGFRGNASCAPETNARTPQVLSMKIVYRERGARAKAPADCDTAVEKDCAISEEASQAGAESQPDSEKKCQAQ